MEKKELNFKQEISAIQQKQPYQKPQICEVQLFADQVLTGCRWSLDPEGCNPISASSG